jgi:SAM-dependent methyltransferase
MTDRNADQIAEWNGALGQRWAELRSDLDKMTRPFGQAGLAAAAPQPGERAIDVGCGCGDTSIALARAVGPKGSVLGVDISKPMLEVARHRASEAGFPQVKFEQADASQAMLPQGQDLLFSRFGVMFFDAPAQAFEHLRQSLKAGGRISFVCWRAPRENPWAMTPVMAGRAAINHQPPPADPNAPGPFAFADAARVRELFAEAGFKAIEFKPFDAPVYLGSSPRSAAEAAAKMGPLSRLVREVGVERLPLILDGVEAAFEPLKSADGSISLKGATWVVTGRNG